jgi:hypothetical protein
MRSIKATAAPKVQKIEIRARKNSATVIEAIAVTVADCCLIDSLRGEGGDIAAVYGKSQP